MAGVIEDRVKESKAMYRGIIEETEYPEQYEWMLEQFITMFEWHMKKNNDYGAANITGFGIDGILVRLWDKICRLMNLNGYKISEIKIEKIPIKKVANEPIDDTFLDVAIYATIARCLLSGKWAK